MIAKIRVPGTSANIGPGFDTLGMAVNIYAEFKFEELNKGLHINGDEKKFADETNLIYLSFLKGLNHIGKKVNGLAIDVNSDIPISRGLGSSSACIVGGILGAYAITNTKIDLEDIFALATKIEGHPDNISPAIFGGLTCSCTIDEKSYHVKYNIDKRFNFVALIPNFESNTHAARKILPGGYNLRDVVYSSSRLGIILKAFENYDKNLLNIAMGDKIHEPYREKIIHEYSEVKQICKDIDSICFFISGSGSTLMNVVEDVRNIDVISEKLKKLKFGWTTKLLKIDLDGAKIL
ncbi:MAG: homoserine kinase [Fusobacteriaceae bacterium]|jgi:homoserine kinase|nr:homoserine kinase [Fusobacteriaceae bacterium]